MTGKEHLKALKEAVKEHKANLKLADASAKKARRLNNTFPKKELELYQDDINKIIESMDNFTSKLTNLV